jgi:hypothetical protein
LNDNLRKINYTKFSKGPNKFKKYIRENSTKFSQNQSDISWNDISGVFVTIDNTFAGNDFRFVIFDTSTSLNYDIDDNRFYYYFPFYQNETLTLKFGSTGYDISYNNISPQKIYFGGIGYDASSQIIPLDPNNPTRTMTIRGIGSGGLELHCLTDMCDVLTPDGYKNVKYIDIGDIVLTEENREVRVKRKTHELYIINENTAPYLFMKQTIADNYPLEDILLSGRHLIKYNDKWYIPEKIGIKQLDIYSVNYYHLELENYTTDNIVINGGTIVESLTSHDPENHHRDAVEWHRRYYN